MWLVLRQRFVFSGFLLASAALAASGCIHSSMSVDQLGRGVPIEAIAGAGAASPDESSDLGLARDAWPEVLVVAPNDPTTALPSFTARPAHARHTARQHGQWPTAVNALDRDVALSSELSWLAELLQAPVSPMVDVFLIPFRMHGKSIEPYQRRMNTHKQSDDDAQGAP